MSDLYQRPQRSGGGGSGGPFGNGQKIFAYVGAAVLTFFIAPQLFGLTIDSVQDYAETNYGFSGGLISFFWGIAIGLISFGGTTLALSAIPSVSIQAIMRFFRGY